MSFLRKNLAQGGRVTEYVKWCIGNCNNNKVTVREHPPSSYEVDVSKNEFYYKHCECYFMYKVHLFQG